LLVLGWLGGQVVSLRHDGHKFNCQSHTVGHLP